MSASSDFADYSSARRRQKSATEALKVSSSMMDSQASARDDTFIASMVVQRWILSAIAVEILLAVYLYTYHTSWGPALEPLRSLTGGPVQYVPVVASFVALIADVGGYALWLLSFGEFVLWVASTAEVVVRLKFDSGDATGKNMSRIAIAAAVMSTLAARPLRIFDVLVLFGNIYVLGIRGDTGERKWAHDVTRHAFLTRLSPPPPRSQCADYSSSFVFFELPTLFSN
jgi:hypothetical protein